MASKGKFYIYVFPREEVRKVDVQHSKKQEGNEALNCSPEYTGQSQTFNLKSE